MASELLIRVIPPPPDSPPSFTVPTPSLPPDTAYVAPGGMLSYELRIADSNTVMGASVLPLTPLPDGMSISGVQMTGTGSGM